MNILDKRGNSMKEQEFDNIMKAVYDYIELNFSDKSCYDKKEMFNEELFKNTIDMGLHILLLDEKNGGINLSYFQYIKVLETIAKKDCSYALVIANMNTFILEEILRFKKGEKLYYEFLKGEVSIYPVFSNNITYTLEDYNLNKPKWYFLINPEYITIIDPENYTKPRVNEIKDKFGLRKLSLIKISFDGINFGKNKNYVCDYIEIQSKLNLVLTAVILGMCKYVLETCEKYSNERILFSKKLIEHEVNRKKIIKMKSLVFIIENLLYSGCLKKDSNEKYFFASMISKNFSVESIEYIVEEGIQMLGAYGLSVEYSLEKIYRDYKMLKAIYDFNDRFNYENTVL